MKNNTDKIMLQGLAIAWLTVWSDLVWVFLSLKTPVLFHIATSYLKVKPLVFSCPGGFVFEATPF